MKVAILSLAVLAGACTAAGTIDPRVAPTVNTFTCLPKGVYVGAAFGVEYTPEQIAIIDLWRIANCDPVPAGYAME